MQSGQVEQEFSNELPITPKEGARSAIFSMYEELGQFSIVLEMQFRMLQTRLPSDSPIQQQVKNLLAIQKGIEGILQRYREAANSGNFGFSYLNGLSPTPVLDIHPGSRVAQEQKEDQS